MTITDGTIDAMHRYGGMFIQQLARLYECADPVNRVRLERTFQDYFDEYTTLARDRRDRGLTG